MSQYELESRWITAEGIAGVQHRFGDIVRVNSAELQGDLFVVIALMSLEPEPTYGVTRSHDEQFFSVSQKDIEATGKNTGRKLIIKKIENA